MSWIGSVTRQAAELRLLQCLYWRELALLKQGVEAIHQDLSALVIHRLERGDSRLCITSMLREA